MSEDWHAEAERLWADGVNASQIAKRLGMSYGMVRRHLDPEWAAEQNKRIREQRARDGRPPDTIYECRACGGPVRRKGATCRQCRRETAEARRTEFIERWNAGHEAWTIAMALGVTEATVHARVSRYRKEGYDVAYRRPQMIGWGKRLGRIRNAQRGIPPKS